MEAHWNHEDPLPLPDAPPPFVGPLVPGAAALPRPAALHTPAGRRTLLRGLPGAVVVVEDEAPRLSRPLRGLALEGLGVRLFLGGSRTWVGAGVPPPVWNDPTVTRSGGNVVQRVYPLGGIGF